VKPKPSKVIVGPFKPITAEQVSIYLKPRQSVELNEYQPRKKQRKQTKADGSGRIETFFAKTTAISKEIPEVVRNELALWPGKRAFPLTCQLILNTPPIRIDISLGIELGNLICKEGINTTEIASAISILDRILASVQVQSEGFSAVFLPWSSGRPIFAQQGGFTQIIVLAGSSTAIIWVFPDSGQVPISVQRELRKLNLVNIIGLNVSAFSGAAHDLPFQGEGIWWRVDHVPGTGISHISGGAQCAGSCLRIPLCWAIAYLICAGADRATDPHLIGEFISWLAPASICPITSLDPEVEALIANALRFCIDKFATKSAATRHRDFRVNVVVVSAALIKQSYSSGKPLTYSKLCNTTGISPRVLDIKSSAGATEAVSGDLIITHDILSPAQWKVFGCNWLIAPIGVVPPTLPRNLPT
jgi:hypothetical protein